MENGKEKEKNFIVTVNYYMKENFQMEKSMEKELNIIKMVEWNMKDNF